MENNAYLNTDSEKYAVGTVNKKAYKDRYHLQWKIKSYFFRYQGPDVTWYSPDFKMWDEIWKFSCKPNIWKNLRESISLRLRTISPTKLPCVFYSFGILNGNDSIHMSTELTPTKSTQKCFEAYLGRSEIIDQKCLIAPNGNVTFFMDICLENRGEDRTSGDDISKEEDIEIDDSEENGSAKQETSNSNGVLTLRQNLSELFLKQQLCDVKIKVGDRQFQAHRCILTARCSVFASMFEHDMKEKESGIIEIEDCDPDAFHVFLLYLYSAQVNAISSKNVIPLYCIADKYDVTQLTKWCEQFMIRNLTVESFCDVLELAVKYNKFILIKASEDFFFKHVEEILDSVMWQNFMKDNFTVANELYINCTQRFKSLPFEVMG